MDPPWTLASEQPFEWLAWAQVCVARTPAGEPVRVYRIRRWDDDSDELRRHERDAFAALEVAATARLDAAGLRRWLAVGNVDDRWAVEQHVDAIKLRDAWKRAARARPCDLELAWRDPGALAGPYMFAEEDPQTGGMKSEVRQGPWRSSDPIRYPHASEHRVARVRVAPIAPRVAVDVAVAVGRVLVRAHAAGLVHGLITSETIELARDGGIWLGRAATFAFEVRDQIEPRTGSSLFSLPFHRLAPETAASLGPPTMASDVYELASTLYELLAFSPPWRRATLVDTFKALATEELPPVSEVHPESAPIEPILSRALARDPRARPTMSVLVSALEDARAGLADIQDSLADVAEAAHAQPIHDRDVVPM